MSIKIVNKLWGNKIFRFATIGVINTATDISILNLVVFAFHVRLLYANLISASISISLSYFWNHFLVFRHKNPVSVKLFIRFFVITAVGILAIQSAVIYGLEHAVSNEQIASTLGLSLSLSKVIRVNGAKLIAVAFSMIWNFILYTFAVFKDDKEEEAVVPY